MRGFPPVQIFLVALMFGVLALPLTHLTQATGQPQSVAATRKSAPNQPQGMHLSLRFAHPPQSLRLLHLGKDLLAGRDLSSSPIEFEAPLALDGEGLELALEARWPTSTPSTAITLEVEPRGMEGRSLTRWSDGHELDELLNLQW